MEQTSNDTYRKLYKAQIRALKAEMKAQGIRVMSCFNGGHTSQSLGYNSRLFELKYKLKG